MNQSDDSVELLLRVNGIQPAFGIEFGLDSPRANELRNADPYRQANVSYSLVQRRGGRIERHTLIDVGMGVVPSLVDFERSHGVHVVDEVLLSHPHLDHIGQLYWLSSCTDRSRRPEQPRPLPVYCTSECWEAGPVRATPAALKKVAHTPLAPGRPLTLGALRVTPLRVEHGPTAPGAVGFVVEHGPRKIILTCDFKTIPQPDDPLLLGADVCLMESNTWHPAPQTSHQSITEGLALLARWRPKRTYLIHYSGYEDYLYPQEPIAGPLTAAELGRAIRAAAAPWAVEPARHGMILGETDAWP